jgi:Skp family chaperone for outer membrane proteins
MLNELWEYQKELDELTKSGGTLHTVSSDLADKEQVYKWLMERKKSHLARLQENLLLDTKVSLGRAEIRGMASKDFQEFMQALKEAMENYYQVKYKYETLLNRSEVLRTFISLEKQKMNIR